MFLSTKYAWIFITRIFKSLKRFKLFKLVYFTRASLTLLFGWKNIWREVAKNHFFNLFNSNTAEKRSQQKILSDELEYKRTPATLFVWHIIYVSFLIPITYFLDIRIDPYILRVFHRCICIQLFVCRCIRTIFSNYTTQLPQFFH